MLSEELLLPGPLRLALLHESADSFLCVRSLHQLVEINPLGASQPFVEMHRVPGVGRFLGECQSPGAELAQMFNRLIDSSGQFIVEHGAIRQTYLRSLFAIYHPPSQN